ncbi:S41 family peptidase [Fodinibius sediminis]|uniref:Carboxyl-terminal processing protease n=1 Tax=Fodinibius sediminis TaxID=1214077 RepID=A0A521DT82_9BACT|nr:S41 family peptidase [Fodinibius sediminis]SMO74917.1 carboxyl-terminal processing protease [Fodinibius sediminis]
MSVKKFLAPNLAIVIALSIFWFAGVETVVKNGDEDQKNLKKYVQAQQRIIDNYVDPVDVTKLYKNSIRGLVANLPDSTVNLESTPLDTTFTNLEVEDLSESIKLFERAYRYLAENYPDQNMTNRTEDALESMFRSLDPHSIYIEPKTSDAIEDEFAGKFQGVGIQFDVIDDTITVITAIAGGPSDQLGIRSGDRIIGINDSTAINFTREQVVNTLRGPKDSKVDVTIKRPHVNELLEYTITRDDIPLYTVDTSYMLDDHTGYVKINRFAATTHEEFMKAMQGLEKMGMNRIILDLRGNPGGYLGQAIAISEEFFSRGTKIVSTKSRHTRFTSAYFSRRDGEYKELPVIVLVNKGSASASEIVSGAIQDHDRGLIVGQRTFGKGLVQQQYELIDSSKIRVTISKYYTPSGRLIQKPYSHKGGEEYAYEIYKRESDARSDVSEFVSHVSDSLKYTTDAGRTVYGGGGIVPDHIVQEDTSQSAAVLNYVQRKGIGFDYVRDYLDDNGDAFREAWKDNFERFREEFHWSEGDMNRVFERLRKNKMVVSQSDTLTEPDFQSDTLYIPEGHWEEVSWMTEGVMKARLALQVWGQKKYFPVINDVFDNAIDKSMNMWDEVQQLKEYAANHTKVKKGQ